MFFRGGYFKLCQPDIANGQTLTIWIDERSQGLMKQTELGLCTYGKNIKNMLAMLQLTSAKASEPKPDIKASSQEVQGLK